MKLTHADIDKMFSKALEEDIPIFTPPETQVTPPIGRSPSLDIVKELTGGREPSRLPQRRPQET